MTSGIYQIRNTLNGKRYIGSAVDFKRRWNVHLSLLRRGRHYNFHLQAAFNKYGEATFIFEILEQIEDSMQLIAREQHYLDALLPEYNISPTAGSQLGFQHTEETKRKMGVAHRREHLSEGTLAKMRAAHTGERNPNYGKHRSEATRAKVREIWTPERRQAYSEMQSGEQNPNYSKHPSVETLAKMSAALTGEHNPMYGKHHSEGTRAKISKALTGERNPNYGRHFSEGTLVNMRKAWTPERRQAYSEAMTGERNPNYGKHPSMETRAKMSIAQKARQHREREARKKE